MRILKAMVNPKRRKTVRPRLLLAALALTAAAPLAAAHAADVNPPAQAFDHDARCLTAGALGTSGVDYRQVVALKIYAIRLKADAQALGLGKGDFETRKAQVETSYLQGMQGAGNDPVARMKAVKTDADACEQALVTDNVPLAAPSPETLLTNYNTDIACLMIYTTLLDEDRLDGLLTKDGEAYLSLFAADGRALGKTEADRLEDFDPLHSRAAAQIMLGISLSIDPKIRNEDGMQGEGDRGFARAQACAAAANARAKIPAPIS